MRSQGQHPANFDNTVDDRLNSGYCFRLRLKSIQKTKKMCGNVSKHTYIYLYKYIYIHVYIQVQTQTHTQTYTKHTRTKYTHAHTYIHTHTNI